MVRLIRAAGRKLQHLSASNEAHDARPVETTDRIDIELTAREELRPRRNTTLGGAYRWWGF